MKELKFNEQTVKRWISIGCSGIIALGLAFPSGATYANLINSREVVNLNNYETFIVEDDNSTESVKALTYMKSAVRDAELNNILKDYQMNSVTQEQAFERFQENLNSTYAEVKNNGFNKDQAKSLFLSAADLETGNAELSPMTFSNTIPDWAPSHPDVDESNFQVSNLGVPVSLLSASDRSSRTNYETTGVGYEVKSLPGYSKTTTYFYPGQCNITQPSGVGAYMFYTLGYNGHAQDIGVGYFNGRWRPIVSGYWTNWGDSSIRLSAGDKLYFKIWVGADQKIYYQIIDGNNFNHIVFQNVYNTNNTLPASGSGVAWNRQITYAANADYRSSSSGYYLRNARFDQSYLYNDYTTTRYQDSNTVSNRRGKFGCSWASDAHVSINSNVHWSSENVSINMN